MCLTDPFSFDDDKVLKIVNWICLYLFKYAGPQTKS